MLSATLSSTYVFDTFGGSGTDVGRFEIEAVNPTGFLSDTGTLTLDAGSSFLGSQTLPVSYYAARGQAWVRSLLVGGGPNGPIIGRTSTASPLGMVGQGIDVNVTA